jgi:protein transport protein SEC24
MTPPIVDFGEIGPIRCIRCKAYMSSLLTQEDDFSAYCARRQLKVNKITIFKFLLYYYCKLSVPAEYFQHLDHTEALIDHLMEQIPKMVL